VPGSGGRCSARGGETDPRKAIHDFGRSERQPDDQGHFREAFKARRCLVITSGFYEWQPTAAQKQPYLIGMKDRSPFALAGLWEIWKDRATGETIESFTVIVGPPNDLVRPIHHRMPAIIDPADCDRWLTASEPPTDLLRPYPADAMEAFPVSTLVNSANNEDPRCIEPI
jgi:putative SOS response-associated peptidase YedK